MLALAPRPIAVYLCVGPTDVRKGFDGWMRVIEEQAVSGHTATSAQSDFFGNKLIRRLAKRQRRAPAVTALRCLKKLSAHQPDRASSRFGTNAVSELRLIALRQRAGLLNGRNPRE